MHNLENYKAIDLRSEMDGSNNDQHGHSSSPSLSSNTHNTPPIDNIQIESVKDVTYVKGKSHILDDEVI